MHDHKVEKYYQLLSRFPRAYHDAAVDGLIKGCNSLDESKSERSQQSYVKRAILFSINNARRLANGSGKPTDVSLIPVKRFVDRASQKTTADFAAFYNAWLFDRDTLDSLHNRNLAEAEWRALPTPTLRPVVSSLDAPIGGESGYEYTLADTIPSDLPGPDEAFLEQEYLYELIVLRDVSLRFRHFLQATLNDAPEDIRITDVKERYYRGLLCVIAYVSDWREKYTIRDIGIVARLLHADLERIVRMSPSHARRHLERLRKLEVKTK